MKISKKLTVLSVIVLCMCTNAMAFTVPPETVSSPSAAESPSLLSALQGGAPADTAADTESLDMGVDSKSAGISQSAGPAAVTYTVSFNSLGGTEFPPITVEAGTGIDLPVPKRAGFSFYGWYADLASADPDNQKANWTMRMAPYTVTKDETVYARWGPDHNPPLPVINVTSSQIISGDTAGAKLMLDGNVSTVWFDWFAGGKECVIDLGRLYSIAQIDWFWANAVVGFTVFAGKTPDDMTEVFSASGGKELHRKWMTNDVNLVARYIKVFRPGSAGVAEMMFYGTPVPDDGYSLESIHDLAAVYTPGSDPYVELSWTAPGMTGYAGTADRYEIRYSDAPVTADNFHSAVLLTGNHFLPGDAGIPRPAAKGTPQSARIYALEGITQKTYYFAIKTVTDWTVTVKSDISNTAEAVVPRDDMPPEVIGGFRAVTVGSTLVKLLWTAPVSGGPRGGASEFYELVYSTQPITEALEDVTFAANLPVPGAPGTDQSIVVSGLVPGTVYYFAIRSTDSANNISLLSAPVSVTTNEPDETPPAVVTGFSAIRSGKDITLSWTAVNDTDVNAYEARYSVEPITDANWNRASEISGIKDMTPAAPGQPQTFVWVNPEKGIYYHFAVRAVDLEGNASPVCDSVVLPLGGKLPLGPDSCVSEYVKGDYTGYVNEQALAGDPAYDPAGAGVPSKAWSKVVSWEEEPGFAVIIDLGEVCYVTDLYMYTYSGPNRFPNIFTGVPFVKEPGGLHSTVPAVNCYEKYGPGGQTPWANGQPAWRSVPLNIETRYIRLNQATDVREIVVYGIKTGREDLIETGTYNRQPASMEPVPIKTRMGINAFIDDNRENISVVGSVREYHNWRWNDPMQNWPNNMLSFSPGNSWDFDEYYTSLKGRGLTVSPCIQGSSAAAFGSNNARPLLEEYKNDPTNPMGYASLASFLYQYAARYGSKKVDDKFLRLANGQPRRSGMDVIEYIEVGNEVDASWVGRDEYLMPFESAALLSAVYDGHEGRMNTADIRYGVKSADPDMKVAMFGMSGKLDYAKAMWFWFKYNRTDAAFAADVINSHHYSNAYFTDNPEEKSNERRAITPEADQLDKEAVKLEEFREKYAPHAEIWMSEFGYDDSIPKHEHPNSWGSDQAVSAIGPYSREEIQAQWILRSYLMLSSTGLDKMHQYMLRDVLSDPNAGKYDVSGLTKDKLNGYERKISWYYVATMRNVLGDMVFTRKIDSGRGDVLIYEYQNKSTGKKGYAVWSPTASANIVEGYSVNRAVLDLPGGLSQMTLTELVGKSTGGRKKLLNFSGNGDIVFDVSECPLFLTEGYAEEPLVVTTSNINKEAQPVYSDNYNVPLNGKMDSMTGYAQGTHDNLTDGDMYAKWSKCDVVCVDLGAEYDIGQISLQYRYDRPIADIYGGTEITAALLSQLRTGLAGLGGQGHPDKVAAMVKPLNDAGLAPVISVDLSDADKYSAERVYVWEHHNWPGTPMRTRYLILVNRGGNIAELRVFGALSDPALQGKEISFLNNYNAGDQTEYQRTNSNPAGFITLPEEPAREGGRVFAGWFYDREATQKFNSSLPILADISLYAGWAEQTHITLDMGFDGDADGEPDTEQHPKHGDGTIRSLPVPDREGYSFAGWYYDRDGQQTAVTDGTLLPEEVAVLYAKWLKHHTLTVYLSEEDRTVLHCMDYYYRSKSPRPDPMYLQITDIADGYSLVDHYVSWSVVGEIINGESLCRWDADGKAVLPAKPGYYFKGSYYYDNGVRKEFNVYVKLNADTDVFCEWLPIGDTGAPLIDIGSAAMDSSAEFLLGDQDTGTIPPVSVSMPGGEAVFDLGFRYKLTGLSVFVGWGNNSAFSLSVRNTDTEAWTSIGSYRYSDGTLRIYEWNEYRSTPVDARYIRIESAGKHVFEFCARGYLLDAEILTPVVAGATINIDNESYPKGLLTFHTSMSGITVPDGYSVVEYGTAMMRNTLLAGADLTRATPGAAIAFRRGDSGLVHPGDVYTLLNTMDVDDSNTVSSGYAGTRYAARAYIVYRNSVTGKEYTLYSGNTVDSSVNRVRRAIAYRLMENEIPFGSYAKDAVLEGTAASISEVWAFILENKKWII